MSKTLMSLTICCVALIASAIASSAMMGPTVVPTGSEKWMPVPGFKGLWIAVLYGTPSKAGSGDFVERYKASSDVTFPAHWHPTDEEVTVLTGTLMIGQGDKVTWVGAKTLTAGGFVGIPAKVHHFGLLKAGGVIQVNGQAPDTLNVIKSTSGGM